MRRDGTSIIYIQYCYSSKKRTNLDTEIAIPPNFWNENKLQVNSNLPPKYGTADDLNKRLKRIRRLAEDLVELGEKRKVDNLIDFAKRHFSINLDLEELEKRLNNQKEAAEALNLDVYHQIDQYIKSKQRQVSPKTIGVYKNVKDHLKAFENFSGKPISFDSFDFDFYETYVDFLAFDYVQPRFKKTPVVGMMANTIGKTIKHLKGFLKDRIKRKIIAPIDLTDFHVPDEETEAIYLSFDDIAKIYYTDLSAYPDLIPDRNRFVVACLTGLRYSDFSTIEPGDVRNGLLFKKQKKTGDPVAIPLQEEALEILEQIFSSNMPVSSNPEFNKNIKIIGKLAGINQPITFTYKKGNKTIKIKKAKCDWITSHTGRRSFCTNEFLAGTPVKLIMMISGHKKEKDFYRYIRISQEEAAEIVKKHWLERNGGKAFSSHMKLAS